MGCGASPQGSVTYKQIDDPRVVHAKAGEEARLAPLLLRLETITNLRKEGLMSANEFEQARSAVVAEIGGIPVAGMSEQKAARLKRAEELRRQVDSIEKQMQGNPDQLPEDYYYVLDRLPPKFIREVPENDEWRHAGSGPMQEYYNNIAGYTMDDILADKNTKLDSHQNPIGPQYDLPRDSTMQEHTLVLCWFSDHGTYGKPVHALKAKGFKVVVHCTQRSTIQQMMVSLLHADVVWVISGKSIDNKVGFDQFLDALERFHRRGGGIFVWGDNAPYFAHANLLLSRLFPGEGIHLEGNDQGTQIMRAHFDGRVPGHLTRTHLIMTGLWSLFEGVTISYLSKVGPLKVLATYNDGPGYSGKAYCAVADAEVFQRCRAPYKIGLGRVVIDGGFTKLYDEHWNETAGTERYVKNASTWLLNINSRIASEGELAPANEEFRLKAQAMPQRRMQAPGPLPPPSPDSQSRNGHTTYRAGATPQAYSSRFR